MEYICGVYTVKVFTKASCLFLSQYSLCGGRLIDGENVYCKISKPCTLTKLIFEDFVL